MDVVIVGIIDKNDEEKICEQTINVNPKHIVYIVQPEVEDKHNYLNGLIIMSNGDKLILKDSEPINILLGR